MYYRELPLEIQQAIKALTRDEVFQNRFSNDKVLDDLDAEKYDPSLCYTELCCLINVPIFIDDKPYNPVSLLQYVYLWCIQNPLIKNGSRELTEIDLDIFFYTLDNKIDCDAVSLASKAVGEIKRRGLELEAAKETAQYLIALSFQPLKMFPQTATVEGSVEVAFDVDWLTSIIAKVQNVTGYSPEKIMNMPLNTCCYYYIQWCRIQGVKDISKRTSEEILQSQSERTDVLVTERLIELGVIKEEDKQEFLEKIKTPPKINS